MFFPSCSTGFVLVVVVVVIIIIPIHYQHHHPHSHLELVWFGSFLGIQTREWRLETKIVRRMRESEEV